MYVSWLNSYSSVFLYFVVLVVVQEMFREFWFSRRGRHKIRWNCYVTFGHTIVLMYCHLTFFLHFSFGFFRQPIVASCTYTNYRANMLTDPSNSILFFNIKMTIRISQTTKEKRCLLHFVASPIRGIFGRNMTYWNIPIHNRSSLYPSPPSNAISTMRYHARNASYSYSYKYRKKLDRKHIPTENCRRVSVAVPSICSSTHTHIHTHPSVLFFCNFAFHAHNISIALLCVCGRASMPNWTSVKLNF